MDILKDILNEIGDFKMKIEGKELSFPGILSQEESDVILKCKLNSSCYNEINRYGTFQIYGDVNGIEVTLLNVYFKSASWRFENQDVAIVFDPSEIVIGKCCANELQVVQITISNQYLTTYCLHLHCNQPVPLRKDLGHCLSMLILHQL